MRDDKSVRPMETLEEVSHIELVWAWVKAHLDDVLSDALLDDDSLQWYQPPSTNLHFTNRAIPM